MAKRKQQRGMNGASAIRVTLSGTKPVMFDRLVDVDDKTQKRLEAHPEERLYLDGQKQLYLPADNMLAFFCSQKGPSCVNRWGPQGPKNKQARQELAENFLAFVDVQPDEILFLRDGKPIRFNGWNGAKCDPDAKLWQKYAAPRVLKNQQIIPLPKTRPVMNLPWELEFTIIIRPNAAGIDAPMVRGFLEAGGPTGGCGTYRPRYGTFELAEFEIKA